MKFGLETMRALVAELGHPELAYPTLLVAGTNGKGSVVAYADSALRASGLRVGRYTSPHLVRRNERIAVGGRPIGDAALARRVLRVRSAAERLRRGGAIRAHPTYFEVMTAAAFDHFRAQGVDVAVIEVGLGGRLDATNVCEPAVSAIVNIGYDHESFLGDTLEAIAGEKAGVLRAGRACVIGAMPAEARRAVVSAARIIGARVVAADAGTAVALERTVASGGSRLSPLRSAPIVVRTEHRAYGPLAVLPGDHQAGNAVVALRLLEVARTAGIRVDLSAIPAAFSGTRWPGRLQWIPGRPPILLDGAHNPDGAAALSRYLKGIGPFVLAFGAMADKTIRTVAAPLFPLATSVVLTGLPSIRRAAPPSLLAQKTSGLASDVHRASTPASALRLARKLAGHLPVVVAGSLFLVGAVLALLEPAKPRPRSG
jgi:dihydrofolate synthase/folylpolyglutamate synthase